MLAAPALAQQGSDLVEFDETVFDAAVSADGGWGERGPGYAQLLLTAPTGREASARITATLTLGALTTRWEQTVALQPGTTEPVALEIPVDGRLDDAADTYLTLLDVTVHDGTRGWGLPRLYVVWADGPDQPPTIWNTAEVHTNAPHGVLDEDVVRGIEARHGDRPIWVSPPTAHRDGPPIPEVRDGPEDAPVEQP